MKRCTRCRTDKPLSEFGKDKSRRDGLYPYCRACMRAYMALLKAQPKHRDRARAYDRKRNAERRKDPAYRAYKRAYERLRKLRMQTNGKCELVTVAQLLARDGDNCSLCGQPLGSDVTLEHNTPLSRGGTHTAANLSLAHLRCNCQKGRLTLAEWRAKRP